MLFKFNRRSSWSKFLITAILAVVYFIYQNYFVSKSTTSSPESIFTNALNHTIEIKEATSTSEATISAITKNLEQALVARVVDGDTIELDNGKKVRYIGIDTPETVSPSKPIGCYGKEASEKNKALVLGKTVFLEKDVSDTDRYGRLLRYVYLDGIMINDLLVKEGYARVSTYPPDVKYQAIFLESEKIAQKQNLGLWGEECATASTNLVR